MIEYWPICMKFLDPSLEPAGEGTLKVYNLIILLGKEMNDHFIYCSWIRCKVSIVIVGFISQDNSDYELFSPSKPRRSELKAKIKPLRYN